MTVQERTFLKKLQQQLEIEQQKLVQDISNSNSTQVGLRNETKDIRESTWSIKPVRADLQDQRVVLTTTSKNMLSKEIITSINAMNIDLSSTSTPSEAHSVLEHIDKQLKRKNESTVATPAIMLNVNSLNEPQTMLLIGLYLYRHSKMLLTIGSAPYFLINGVDTYLTARTWRNILTFAEDELYMARGTIKLAIVIDESNWTDCDEILYELQSHCAGVRVSTDELPLEGDIVQYILQIAHTRNAHVLCMKESIGPSYEFHREAITGFDGIAIKDESLLNKARKTWNHHMPEVNQIWKKRKGLNLLQVDSY